MDGQTVLRETGKTMASLEAVRRCEASPEFVNRVTSGLLASEENAEWWPTLATAVVILLCILDSATLGWSLSGKSPAPSRTELVRLTHDALWVDPPGYPRGDR